MNFCANLSLLYTEYPLRERFAAAKRDGFNNVEIQFPYELPLFELQSLLAEQQQRCVLINVPAGDLMQGGEGLACVPARQAEFNEALALCQTYARGLQVRCVNVLPGRCFDEAQHTLYYQTLQRNLRQAADAFQSMGIVTTFEAINTIDMPSFLVSTADQMLDLIHAIQHPNLKAQWDIYHMARMQQPLAAWILKNALHVGHIQFADSPQRHEPGTGTLDFKSLFAAIDASGYRGWVGAEYRPSGATSDSFAWKSNR